MVLQEAVLEKISNTVQLKGVRYDRHNLSSLILKKGHTK